MQVKVRFRFNKVTGEVEVFEVEDTGPAVLPVDEHNRLHDQIAANVGNVLERNPHISEVLPGTAVPATETAASTAATPTTTGEPPEAEPEPKAAQRSKAGE